MCVKVWQNYPIDLLPSFPLKFELFQVRVCREKTSGHVYAMKKLKKSEMLRRGQVTIIDLARLCYSSPDISSLNAYGQ